MSLYRACCVLACWCGVGGRWGGQRSTAPRSRTPQQNHHTGQALNLHGIHCTAVSGREGKAPVRVNVDVQCHCHCQRRCHSVRGVIAWLLVGQACCSPKQKTPQGPHQTWSHLQAVTRMQAMNASHAWVSRGCHALPTVPPTPVGICWLPFLSLSLQLPRIKALLV